MNRDISQEKELLLSHSYWLRGHPSFQPEPEEERELGPSLPHSRQEAPRPSTSDLGFQEGIQTGTLLASCAGAGTSLPHCGADFGLCLQVRAI